MGEVVRVMRGHWPVIACMLGGVPWPVVAGAGAGVVAVGRWWSGRLRERRRGERHERKVVGSCRRVVASHRWWIVVVGYCERERESIDHEAGERVGSYSDSRVVAQLNRQASRTRSGSAASSRCWASRMEGRAGSGVGACWKGGSPSYRRPGSRVG